MGETKRIQGAVLPAVIAAGLVALVAALVLSLSLGTSEAYAGGGRMPVEKFKGTQTIEYGYYKAYYYWADKGTVKNVKSSNKKVVTAKVKGAYLMVTPKGPGTATLSFKLKGKTRKVKMVVYKRENPVSSFMVGSTECASYFDDSHMMNANVTGAVNITPAKGWTLKGIEAGKPSGKTKKVKNGFTLTKGMLVNVTLYNKSKKLSSTLELYSF